MIACGCKGVRVCKLCEPFKPLSLLNTSTDFNVYSYCNKCSNAFIGTLNDDCSCHPPGFIFNGVTVLHNFLSEEEERTLIETLDKSPWVPSQSGRNKQDYGVKVNFKKKRISVKHFTGLPSYSRPLVERLHHRMRTAGKHFDDFYPVELCNLEYLPELGSAIVPHHDDVWLWGERLVLLNIVSASKMSFTLPPISNDVNEEWDRYASFASTKFSPEKVNLPPRIVVPLPRRSLLIIAGKARFTWLHAINREDILSRRISLTMRELSPEYLPPPCLTRPYAVHPAVDGKVINYKSEVTSSQKLGLELIKIAANFNGISVASASGQTAEDKK